MAENNNEYDFFILYDEEQESDREYAQNIMQFLETEQRLRGYAEFRDSQAGRTIFHNFEHALKKSRFVLVLISNESVKDNWWDRQVETTLHHHIQSRMMDKVVPIYLPNLNTSELPTSLTIFNGAHYDADRNNRFWRLLARVFDE